MEMSTRSEALEPICLPAEVPTGPRAKIRAVVVDDHPAILEAICAVLEVQGLVEVVGQASDGVEAVHAVAELKPDLVVMDVCMPRMNGLETASVLLQHFPEMRVVLMSGEPSAELREQCRAAGADGFVFKVDFAAEFAPLVRGLFAGQGPRFTV
jgi:DNA-binding NarL/FixJ family response regulator